MTKVTIDRELLERVAQYTPSIDRQEDRARAISELRSILESAPRQPDGDHGWLVSLELPELQCNCAWNPDSHDKTCPVYLRDRMADAQRAIAELREECERLRGECARLESKYERDVWGLNNEGDPIGGDPAGGFANDLFRVTTERDTLRQQLAERDAEIMEQCRLNGMGAERELKLLTQRDKLADLLDEVTDDFVVNYLDADLIKRIDAALAEVNP